MKQFSEFLDEEYVDIMVEALAQYKEHLIHVHDSVRNSSEDIIQHQRYLEKIGTIQRSLDKLPIILKQLQDNKLLMMFLNRKMKDI